MAQSPSSRLRPALLLLAATAAAAAAPVPLFSASAPTLCGATTSLQVLRVDSSWLTPDALFDAARGRLHVVFGTAGKDAFYAFSDGGGGGAFSAPVKLNTAGLGVTTTMGERGPKIAMSADGRLIVVWADLWTGAGCRTFARSVFSSDGGATWSSPASIAPGVAGVDGLSVAAGTAGTPLVVATYHVNISSSPPPNATSATYLHYSLSSDGAKSWGVPQLMVIDGGGTPAIACSMCMTRPRIDADTGELLVAYRAAINNVRDFRVVRAAAGAATNDFTTAVVNARDGWVVDYCPMNGPEMTLSVPRAGAADATQTVAFMNGDANNVYFSQLAPGSAAFAGHVPTPLHEANERYPTAVASPDGDVVLVWNVGPMAVSGDAAVKWACYAPGNATAAQSGTLGRSFAGTKATALSLGDHGGLLVITSAGGTPTGRARAALDNALPALIDLEGAWKLVAGYEEDYTVAPPAPDGSFAVACVGGPCTSWKKATITVTDAAALKLAIAFDSGFKDTGVADDAEPTAIVWGDASAWVRPPAPPPPRAITVHVCPSTHMDPGWFQTVDDLYEGLFRHTITNVTRQLGLNAARTFTAEIAIVWGMFVDELGDEALAALRPLVASGQLE